MGVSLGWFIDSDIFQQLGGRDDEGVTISVLATDIFPRTKPSNLG